MPPADPIASLARAAPHRPAGELGDVVAEVAHEVWGARSARILIATYEQSELVDLGPHAEVVAVADGPAGRCYVTGEAVSEDDTTWLPLTHRGERFGVLAVGGSRAATADLTAYADAVALHLAASRGSSDRLEIARRTQVMGAGAELVQSLAPPLSYSDARVSLAAIMEPSYSSGGDAIDYAIEDGVLQAVVLDATGHGWAAALVSAAGVAAYRAARRAGEDLLGTWAALDRFVGEAGGSGDDARYATAVLLELDLDTGRLSWLTAGHPAPIVLRASGEAEVLEADPAPPLGTGLGGAPAPAEDYLEPGDVVALHTDGMTEARALDGHLLGTDAYVEVLRSELAHGGLLAEALRRIGLDLLTRDDTWQNDDATAVLVRWHG